MVAVRSVRGSGKQRCARLEYSNGYNRLANIDF